MMLVSEQICNVTGCQGEEDDIWTTWVPDWYPVGMHSVSATHITSITGTASELKTPHFTLLGTS